MGDDILWNFAVLLVLTLLSLEKVFFTTMPTSSSAKVD